MNIEAYALLLELVDQLWSNTGQVDAQTLDPIVEVRINSLNNCTAAAVEDIDRSYPARIDVIEEAAVAHSGYRRIAGSNRGAFWFEAGCAAITKQLPSEECDHCEGQEPEGNQTPALVHS
jgi:hypothetical protein